MRPSECGFASPPDPDSADGEIIARFRDFLAAAGPAARPDADGEWSGPLRPPAERYHLRFLAWRMGPEALELSERLA